MIELGLPTVPQLMALSISGVLVSGITGYLNISENRWPEARVCFGLMALCLIALGVVWVLAPALHSAGA